MHLLQTNYFKFTITIVFGLRLTVAALCPAGEKEELVAVNALITIVESGKMEQAKQAVALFQSIPDESKMKPIAAYSLALVHIREHQFSEAWNAITKSCKEQDSLPDSIKCGKERLKLWLLLEARSTPNSEKQFDQVVAMTVAASDARERADNCGFVGGVVGMLKSREDSACVPPPILDSAKELLLSKVETKNAKTELEVQFAEATKWGGELVSMVGIFESIGTDKANEQNKSTQAAFEHAKLEQLTLRDDLKSAGGEKRDLDDQRRKEIRDRNREFKNVQWEKSNPPARPVDPGPRPRQPTEPRAEYETDPKTGKRELKEPSSREESAYKRSLAQYTSWPTRYSQFQRDSATYPTRVQQWQERIAALEARVQASEVAIRATENAMKNMQEDIKQGVGKEVKDAGDQFEHFERLAAVSNIAYQHITSKDPKDKNIIRPSNFRLIDYEAEGVLLRRSLR